MAARFFRDWAGMLKLLLPRLGEMLRRILNNHCLWCTISLNRHHYVYGVSCSHSCPVYSDVTRLPSIQLCHTAVHYTVTSHGSPHGDITQLSKQWRHMAVQYIVMPHGCPLHNDVTAFHTVTPHAVHYTVMSQYYPLHSDMKRLNVFQLVKPRNREN